MDTLTAELPDEGSETPVPMVDGRELGPGTKLGPYEIISPIASGGMGRVWLCARRGDFGFSRTFALKTMREDLASDPSFRRMFLAEAKLAARVRHTNVVEMIDLGESEGVVYQVMTWVDGASLSGLMQRAFDTGRPKPSADVAMRVVSDILRGLHAAHELRDDDDNTIGLVHRDVSPQNILVGLDGVSKITDFGIAKATTQTGHTDTGLRGKPRFMAPEQLEGAAIDRRSDVFAAGIILWELLSGERSTGIGADVLMAHVAPRLANSESIPRGAADIVARALLQKPAERFATAAAMAEALDRAAADAGIVLSSTSVGSWVSTVAGADIRKEQETILHAIERTRSQLSATGRSRRNRWGLSIGVAAVAIAGGVAALVHYERPSAARAPIVATAESAGSPVAAAGPTTATAESSAAVDTVPSTPPVVPTASAKATPKPAGVRTRGPSAAPSSAHAKYPNPYADPGK